jgi:xanthine/CO dehydrogenase XdhC/CoxF family maturation factor
MRELGDILAAFESMAPSDVGVLANIVHASGSTYRRVGARLLVLPDDALIGLISGGCLEGDLVARASEVRSDAAPRLVHYDATAEDDIVWGLGLGCAGVVDVLLEPVAPGRPGPLAWLGAWRKQRGTGVLATALDPAQLGRRWALHPDGSVEGDPSDEVRAALLRARSSGRSARISTREGDVTVEVARPPRRLVVFGAGPDAAPVVRLAVELGWDVDLVDHRTAYARAERFPGARVHLVPTEDAVARVRIDRDTYVLVMTHHYLIDRALLSELLPSPTPYIGLLGPKQRAEDLLADLAGLGIAVSAEQRARLHGPAGLDIGGEGPEAIALSLVAEVMAAAEGRPAGSLRDRKGPIHEPEYA